MILETKITQRMRNTLEGIRDTVGVIVHGVNTPFITCLVMLDMPDTVDSGVSHIDIR